MMMMPGIPLSSDRRAVSVTEGGARPCACVCMCVFVLLQMSVSKQGDLTVIQPLAFSSSQQSAAVMSPRCSSSSSSHVLSIGDATL